MFGNTFPKWDHSLIRKRKFHPLLRKLGIHQCGFPAFRHGNATLLDQIGAPMEVRQNRLGHADAQTTMDYTHAVTADERRIAVELGRNSARYCTERTRERASVENADPDDSVRWRWLRGVDLNHRPLGYEPKKTVARLCLSIT